jgi:hypothetical protein
MSHNTVNRRIPFLRCVEHLSRLNVDYIAAATYSIRLCFLPMTYMRCTLTFPCKGNGVTTDKVDPCCHSLMTVLASNGTTKIQQVTVLILHMLISVRVLVETAL